MGAPVPHLLYLELDHGLRLRFECLAESPIVDGCATWYENDVPFPDPPPHPPGTVARVDVPEPCFVRFDGGREITTPMSEDEVRQWRLWRDRVAGYQRWVPKDECWVVNHAAVCIEEEGSVLPFLEDLGCVGPVTGPIPVEVWCGPDSSLVPRIQLWSPENLGDQS